MNDINAIDQIPHNRIYHYTGGRVLKDNKATIVRVIVDPNVKKIDDEAFEECRSLQSIELPDGLEEIGGFVFGGCRSLTSIKLPMGLKKIGEYAAFAQCSSLTSISLPDGMKEIGAHAFEGCSSLTSVHLPDGLKKIGNDAFRRCSSLKFINIPDEVEEIGFAAFSGCSSLTSINLPGGLKNIGEGTFQDCSSLTSIALPPNLTIIDELAFSKCTSLLSIALPTTVTILGNDVFSGCVKSLRSISMQSSSSSSHQCVNTVRLFAEVVQMMTPQNMAIWAKTKTDDNGRSPLMTAAAVSLKWKDTKCIFDAYMPDIKKPDPVTGFAIFMLAAVGRDSKLESVYRLLRELPHALEKP